MNPEIRNPNRVVGCVKVEHSPWLRVSGFGYHSEFAFSPRWRAVAAGRISDFKRFAAILFLSGVSAASAGNLEVEIVPRFNRALLVFDSVTNATAAEQTTSVTRLDFLLSTFALPR